MNISTSVWLTLAVAVVAAVVAAVVGELVALGVRRLGRTHEILATLAQRGRRPLAGGWGALPPTEGRDYLSASLSEPKSGRRPPA